MSAFEKTWFVLSLTILAFGYGYACHAWEFFPHSHVQRAWIQAKTSSFLPSAEDATFLEPRVHDRSGAFVHDSSAIQPGLTLITSTWPESEGFRLIDAEGNLIHKWEVDRDQVFPDPAQRGKFANEHVIHGTHLLPNGDIVFNVEYVGTVRVDACSDVVWTNTNGNHHSVERDEDGSFWTPAVSQTPQKSSERYPEGYPGLKEAVWIDYALHLSPNGEVLNKINILDVIYGSELSRYIAQVDHHTYYEDFSHMNDVEPLSSELADEYPLFEDNDLLVSLRNLNLVFVFDPQTLEVKWHAQDPFIQQHDPDFVGGGWITVFDNNRLWTDVGGSRILRFHAHSDSLQLQFPETPSSSFYTPKRGKVQRLENNNLLLTESQRGRVLEVTPSGRTVWEWIHAPRNESMVAAVTNGTRHQLTPDDVASWPCSSVDSLSSSSP